MVAAEQLAALWHEVLFVLWLFAPAGIANMAPIFAARLPGLTGWTAPIDGGAVWRGRRLFGDHKTWRGLVAGIVAAVLVLALQQWLVKVSGPDSFFGWVSHGLDYSFGAMPTLLVGPLFAIGALGGDALKSFFKRQFNIAPGRSWFPFDQTDYIIGGALAVLPFIRLSVGQYAILFVVWLLTHLLSSWLGYLMRLKEQPI